MEEKNVTDWFAILLKITLAVIVLGFLGSESIAFFNFIFPPEQWYMAYTGFGLTSGALLVYLFLFLKDAKTSLQKTVSIIMMVIGIVGELATAGFGMQIEAWSKANWEMTQSDFVFMVLAVRILMFAHAIALLAYSFGDKIQMAFDKNKNGIPDFIEKKNAPAPDLSRQYQSQIEALELKIKELENPTKAGSKQE